MLIVPVSYTHLDVYKRQIIFHARPEMELANKVLDLRNVNQVLLGEGVETDFEYNADRFRKKYNINEPYIISVSYTHLDVYKRQVHSMAGSILIFQKTSSCF